MRMYLISDNRDTYTGMRLAGVEGSVVSGKDELRWRRRLPIRKLASFF